MKSVKSVRNIMKKFSLTLLTLSACSMSSVLTSDAAAALATYSNFGYWQSDVTATGDSVATETFDSYNGYYTSLSGTTGGIAWNADASGGIFIGHIYSGLFSTNFQGVAATFTFSLRAYCPWVGTSSEPTLALNMLRQGLRWSSRMALRTSDERPVRQTSLVLSLMEPRSQA